MFIILSAAIVKPSWSECSQKQDNISSAATQLKNLTYQQKTEWKGYKVSESVSWIIETSTTNTVYHFYHSRKKPYHNML